MSRLSFAKNRLLGLKPARQVLNSLADVPYGFRLLNRRSRPNAVFESLKEAELVSRQMKRASHEDEPLIAGNFQLSLERRPSDYAALFWLAHVASREPISVLDFGGGAGQVYYQYFPLLGPGVIRQWTVVELPGVVEYGRRVARQRGADRLAFVESLKEAGTHDVLLAAGSLHYWDQPMADMGKQLGELPPHLLINRSPFRRKRGAFYTVQSGREWAVPCLVRNLDELAEELAALGYESVDRWEVAEKRLHFPWLPAYEAPYQGAYFHHKST